MLHYEIELRLELLAQIIPIEDTLKIKTIAYQKYNNDLIELSNALRMGKDKISIEESSESLFIWIMLEETTLETISKRIGPSLITRIETEVKQKYLNDLENNYTNF
jgi:hypothetical protein